MEWQERRVGKNWSPINSEELVLRRCISCKQAKEDREDFNPVHSDNGKSE